ncbi:MAG: hypothetical protein Q8L27_03905 [archaeon]|nr:hypothetical protein [archaeon]
MDYSQLMLLSQLVRKLSESTEKFENAYNSSNKIDFEASKKAMFDIHKKMEFLLK